MRDLVLTLFIFGLLPVAFFRPFVGLTLWAWISYMNPHRLTWSFAYNFRFNLIVAMITILGILFHRQVKLRIPLRSTSVLLIIFVCWTILSAFYALRPEAAMGQVDIFLRIQIMVVATMMLIQSRRQIIGLVAVIAFSIGFYGLKGGIFTLNTGGRYRVLGPDQSFFIDNNHFAAAMIMTIPLVYFLYIHSTQRLLRYLMIATIGFSLLAVLGSYSRGGFVGLAVVGLIFWWKSRHKILSLLSLSLLAVSTFWAMPASWHDRMTPVIDAGLSSLSLLDTSEKKPNHPKPANPARASITTPTQSTNNKTMPSFEILDMLDQDHELLQDKSVTGRLDAWRLALLVANDHPILGGGFRTFDQSTFDRYTPGVYRHAAHSIYFEILAEQGYVGFTIWLLLQLSALQMGRWIIRQTRNEPDLRWANDLARMFQVSMVGYYAAGAFLSMGYFDLPYHLMAILIMTKINVENYYKEKQKILIPPPRIHPGPGTTRKPMPWKAGTV
ncbi:MAG: putative O-glycosylation ligase, exosortase A system-associated [Magnetococcales bacterium]|nr:putative O-glycosylation ligase, exosortase A system-associated [Magnetococcales bacterium]